MKAAESTGTEERWVRERIAGSDASSRFRRMGRDVAMAFTEEKRWPPTVRRKLVTNESFLYKDIFEAGCP